MNPLVHMGVVALFVVFSFFTVAGACVAVFSGRVIRGVSGLAICSVGLSGYFYFLGSPFIALMEILIYIGAVCMTIIFAIMLAEPDETSAEEKREAARPGAIGWTLLGLLAAAGIFVGLLSLGLRNTWKAPAQPVREASVEALGVSLLTTYSLAFEMISLVLLVAILGALAIARGGRKSAQ